MISFFFPKLINLDKRWVSFFAILFISLASYGQTVGDYGTTSAGPNRWDQSGSWIVCVTNGTWTGATAASAIPTAGTNVWIRSGHTILVRTSNGANVCNNMDVSGSVVYRNNNSYTLTVNGNITGTGSIDMSAGTGNSTLDLAGNYSNTGTFTCSNGTVNYNGTSSQNIGTLTYNNLTISRNSIKTILANISVGGNLTIQTGSTLDLSSFTANRSSAGGTISIDGTSTLLIGGAGTFPSNYATNTLSAGSNVNYNGTAQTVGINSYSNLTLSGSGAKTFPAGTTTVNGILSIEGTATTTVNGTLTYTAGATLQYKGSAAQISGNELPASISNLIINNSLGVNLISDVSVNSTLTLTGGIVTVNATKTLKIGSAAGIISGGSATEYIDGSLSRVMNNGITYAFPVGKSACGYHQFTFSNLNVSAATEMKVTFACSGATTGDGTITNPMPININWHLERVGGTFTDATVKLEGSEIEFTNTIAQSALQPGVYSKVTSTAASGSVTAASIGAIATDKWLAIGSSKIKTYYSYQTGSWNTSSTWTLDPSGTTQVGSSVPVNDDFVSHSPWSYSNPYRQILQLPDLI